MVANITIKETIPTAIIIDKGAWVLIAKIIPPTAKIGWKINIRIDMLVTPCNCWIS